MFIYDKLYEYKYINIFKIYSVCVYLYINNKYTHILCKQKLLFWM